MTSQENKLLIPRDFICPITHEIMQNPVLLIEDGHSYELDAIERWLNNHNTSPMTNKPLSDRRFVNNFNLKSAIEEYCAQQSCNVSNNKFLTFNIRYSRIPSVWKDKPVLHIRLSLLGSSNTGKTTLARYLQYGSQSALLNSHSSVTVGPDLSFFHLDQLYEDKYVIMVQLADIPGMERYESCCDNHFRHCHGALIVTDSTDMDSLQRAELYWYKQLQSKGQEHVEAILVCNKVDLFKQRCSDDYKKEFLDRAEHFASLHNMSIYHISALHGDNIHMMFKQLILRILQNESLLQHIKDANTNEEKSTIKVKKGRRIPTAQSTSPSESTRQNDCERSSSQRCC